MDSDRGTAESRFYDPWLRKLRHGTVLHKCDSWQRGQARSCHDPTKSKFVHAERCTSCRWPSIPDTCEIKSALQCAVLSGTSVTAINCYIKFQRIDRKSVV